MIISWVLRSVSLRGDWVSEISLIGVEEVTFRVYVVSSSVASWISELRILVMVPVMDSRSGRSGVGMTWISLALTMV